MIVPVKKIRLITETINETKLINTIQLTGKFMLLNDLDDQMSTEDQQHLKQIENTIEKLSEFQKRKLFEYREVTIEEFNKVKDDAKKIIVDVSLILTENENLKNKKKEYEDTIKLLTPYENLDINISDVSYLEKTKVLFGYYSLEKENEILDKIEKYGYIVDKIGNDTINQYSAIIVPTINIEEAKSNLISSSFTIQELPMFNNRPFEVVNDFSRQVLKIEEKLNLNEIKLNEFSDKLDLLKTYYDYRINKILTKKVKLSKTETTVFIEGWVAEDKLEEFKEEINKEILVEIEELDVSDEDQVPTLLRNNKFVSQFEVITNMFSPPNPNEIDPNPAMSVWYWLIFGIMMGDVGYGLSLIVVFALFNKFVKPKGDTKKLINVFAISGISATIFGILFGSFFGADFDLLNIIGKWFGNSNLTSVVINPIDSPLPMLVASIVIGALHIITGLVIKVILEFRRKNYIGAFASAISWILVLIGIGIAVVFKPMYIGATIAGIGALLILFLSGYEKKGFFGKLLSGLGGLYGASSYLSDILSYSRILALSLSGAVIAFTMNMLAGMVAGGVIGYFFAIIIYIIGHVFNFAMSLLSTYVHDGRLQYLEFFGKFYEGEGKLFQPFEYQLKYTNKIVKEKNIK